MTVGTIIGEIQVITNIKFTLSRKSKSFKLQNIINS